MFLHFLVKNANTQNRAMLYDMANVIRQRYENNLNVNVCTAAVNQKVDSMEPL